MRWSLRWSTSLLRVFRPVSLNPGRPMAPGTRSLGLPAPSDRSYPPAANQWGFGPAEVLSSGTRIPNRAGRFWRPDPGPVYGSPDETRGAAARSAGPLDPYAYRYTGHVRTKATV